MLLILFPLGLNHYGEADMGQTVISGIWLGDFASVKEFNKYIDRDEDDSEFNQEFGLPGWLMEEYEFETPAAPVDSLLRNFWGSAVYSDDAIASAKSLGIKKATAAVFVQWIPEKLDEPIDTSTFQHTTSPLRFIGAYEHDEAAPSVAEEAGDA